MAAARCDEDRTETKTGRGREFPFTLENEIPRNEVMFGVERDTATELQGLATSKATANMTSVGPSDLQKRTAEDRWNPFMLGRDIVRGKVAIGTESRASTTRRTTTESAETQEDATAGKAATTANAATAGTSDAQKRATEDGWSDPRNHEASWREATHCQRQPSYSKGSRWAQKRSRRQHLWCRAEDITTRKVQANGVGTVRQAKHE